MKRLLASLLLGFAAVLSALAWTGLTDAEVRKVDQDGAELALKHGEIRNLDMPAMTMVFNVKDPRVLEQVKAADTPKFKTVSESGKHFATEIQVVR